MPATPTPVTSYPASDPGFAAVPVDDLLAGEADLIARIKLCYGIDRDSFERDVLALVRRYAACVHLLPATADNYFSNPAASCGSAWRPPSSACKAPMRTSSRGA
jgi:conjugal transfer pilus assembly protein TraI